MNNIVKKNETPIINIKGEDVKKYFCPTASTKEIGLFLNIAKSCGLNPFLRELHLIKYGDNPAQIVTGYEVYLKRAERSAKYAGFKTWIEGKIPDMKACIEVYRKDWDKALYHEVEYSEYVCKTKEGKITRFWAGKPKTMLKKVVISQAFRFAFPDELAGIPKTADEINDISIEEIYDPKANVSMPKESVLNRTPEALESKPEGDMETIEFPDSPKKTSKSEENQYSKMLNSFKQARKTIGDTAYYRILFDSGVKHANEIRSIARGNEILSKMREKCK